jgi:ribose 5-phosphate isomerase A
VAALPELKGCKPVLRLGDCSNNKPEPGKPPAVTDNGNYIIDLHFDKEIADVPKAAAAIKKVVGVVDHGIFVGMTHQTIIAYKDGSCKVAGKGGKAPWWGQTSYSGSLPSLPTGPICMHDCAP